MDRIIVDLTCESTPVKNSKHQEFTTPKSKKQSVSLSSHKISPKKERSGVETVNCFCDGKYQFIKNNKYLSKMIGTFFILTKYIFNTFPVYLYLLCKLF